MATATMPKPKATTKQQPKTRTVQVLEFFSETPRIDKEKGIVYGAKFLGRVSENGHRYSDQALHDAARVYNQSVVNLDHPPNRNATAERGVRERFGVPRNAAVKITGDDKTDGVYGEHHYPLAHPYTPEYLEILERFPNSIGFSHNAVVTESVHDGKVEFTSVQRVRSVDLVANPATTRGVFESMDPTDPNYVAPTTEATATDPNADTTETEPTTEEKLCEALKAQIDAILDDPETELADKISKITLALKAHDKLTNGKGDDEVDDEKSDDEEGDEKDGGDVAKKDDEKKDEKKDSEESVRDRLTKLEAELKAKNTLEAARDKLEAADLRPTKTQVKAFSVLESDAERSEFIDTLKAAAKATAAPGGGIPPAKPRSVAANALESARGKPDGKGGANGFAVPKSHDDLKAITADLLN